LAEERDVALLIWTHAVVDDPLSLAENSEDMAALDRFEGGSRQVRARCRGATGELGIGLEVEDGARREDPGALHFARETTGRCLGSYFLLFRSTSRTNF
jgi:hypothetical protein